MSYLDLAVQVAQEFAQSYGRHPRWIVAAPGRVNVIGEHTDYN
ncbi:MAG TPA: galactokinase family protein, partial [Verrucomicrobiae bacterium]